MMFLRFLFIVLLIWPISTAARERLVVFAASSQMDAMAVIGEAFEAKCDCDLVFSYAASSVLARQIYAGASADVFISANSDWIDWLNKRQQLNSTVPFVGNRLVLISADAMVSPSEKLNNGRFAMADPRSVPAGLYAKQALEAMKFWHGVQQNAVYAENVRIALAMVLRGDLSAGIVYHSDLLRVPDGAKLFHYVFPPEMHEPISYVAAHVNEKPLGKQFVEFLQMNETQKMFERLGFSPLSDK